MKNILKMVYGNQKEVKLESQVFEFGLIDDVKKLSQEGKGASDVLKREFENLKKGNKQLVSAQKDFDRYLDNAMNARAKYRRLDVEIGKTWNNLVNKTREIGVNVYDVDGAKELDSVLKSIAISLSDIDDLIRKLNK